MILITVVAGALAALLVLPLLSDLMSAAAIAIAGDRARIARGALRADATPRLLFLIPAHDEELMIAQTLDSFESLQYPASAFSVTVIADNCTDATAAIVRARGVQCLERFDAERRGKPYALAWALEQLPVSQYDAVVIFDADSLADPDLARALALEAPLQGKAAQLYTDVRNRSASALTEMGALFARMRFALINELKRHAGLNVPLGNGLMLGRDVLAAHGWSAFSICEDWETYALLTAKGVPIINVPGARMYAEEARSLQQSDSQRQRWAAGKLTVLGRYATRLLRAPKIGARQKLDALAELSEPGPVVLLGVSVVVAAPALALHIPGAWWIVALLTLAVGRIVVYALVALAHTPRPGRLLAAFAYLPIYLVWRLGVQLRSLAMLGDQPWVRTARAPAERAVPPAKRPVARKP